MQCQIYPSGCMSVLENTAVQEWMTKLLEGIQSHQSPHLKGTVLSLV